MKQTEVETPRWSTLMGRALRMRCPLCGEGRFFDGLVHMRKRCSSCGYHFERGEPGYFVGAMYVSYATTVGLILVGYLLSGALLEVTARQQIAGIAVFALVFPFAFFRYSRAFWMAADLSSHPPQPSDFSVPPRTP